MPALTTAWVRPVRSADPQRLVGDVADQHLALAGERKGEVAQAILVEIGKDELARAVGGEAGGDRGADSGGGAGDEGDGVGEIGHGGQRLTGRFQQREGVLRYRIEGR